MTAAKDCRSWQDAWRVYTRPQVLGMIVLGFSAGLPFLLVFSTLSAWLRDAGTARTVIGFFSWVGVTYSIKVLWAPVIDRLPLPLLTRWMGKRRSWMLVAQLGIAAGLLGMSSCQVTTELTQLALFAVLVAFASATQDITIDAYRIEALDPDYQGAMAATYVLGYRVALLVAGAGAFYIAEYHSWQVAYQAMAALMLLGIIMTGCIQEPLHPEPTERGADRLALSGRARLSAWFTDAVIGPFADFFHRNGRLGCLILALIAVYKLSDITMGVMANPFYLDLGFSKTEIANVTKLFGFVMTIVGAAVGGLLVVRYGIMKPMVLGSVLIMITNLLFAALAMMEPDWRWLALVISADNFSGGLASSAFIAYLSSLTHSAYTATQYALFSSLMTLPAKLLGGFSGIVVDGYGYPVFFVYAGLIGLPAIGLAVWFMTQPKPG